MWSAPCYKASLIPRRDGAVVFQKVLNETPFLVCAAYFTEMFCSLCQVGICTGWVSAHYPHGRICGPCRIHGDGRLSQRHHICILTRQF